MKTTLRVVVALWSGVVLGSQTLAPLALPEPLRTHVKSEDFGIVTSIRGLPLGVRDALQTLFGSNTLDIAEPGAEFQATAATGPTKLPTRRLLVAGCSEDHCLVYYERGGPERSWHLALFHWTPSATRFEWGGIASRGLTSVDAVRKAALSGAIKGPNHVW